jgi:hypothetical protein
MTWPARRLLGATTRGATWWRTMRSVGRRSGPAGGRCCRREIDERPHTARPATGPRGHLRIGCDAVRCMRWWGGHEPLKKEEACEIMMPDWMPGSCRVWPHDSSPARDVAGRDVVGEASEPAPPAAEHIPRGAVPLVDVAALRAFSRGVPRVHQHYGHSGEFRLVGDERPELPECRGVRVPILRDRASARDLG